ncbi:citrate (pro-3S)-lyase subunit beta [Caproiciproducens sp. NJN-50]|uniref:citrate (pro-3S)-lyase subunit beta n=1 Tax=Caproiciproducens sp. NJN-50 TaxID=2507162 RepID=UPI000FFE1CD3|nr:citrate (pro-3S)-lyase subunit beta [Caproiciproducens sp. NJN-50]QAT48759.1 citrate (pro-3S)-lyase subunit beta [Caproiciproducens sp. NJN-50]
MKQLRRTMLYVPGNNPGMIRDAGIYDADCIMFDLEDSVSVAEKDSARFLVYEMLRTIKYPGRELIVRVNALDTQTGIDDLEAMVRTRKAAIRLPKTECARDVVFCDQQIGRVEKENGIPAGSTRMMAAVESAKGVLNAREIALASPRLIGIAIGAEDYVTDLKTNRSPEGIELLFGRSMVLLAARAAGIDAIDTVYSDVNNEEGFRKEVALVRQLGFDGKSIINPRQIKPVHEIYTPSGKEIEKSLAIMDAIEEAHRKGSGVIALNGKMIDKPIVARARRVLDLAQASGLLKGEGNDIED